MELLHHLASGYAKRPSELVGITDEIAALNLDACVLVIGKRAEERAYEEASAKKPANNKRPASTGKKKHATGTVQAKRNDWLALARAAKR